MMKLIVVPQLGAGREKYIYLVKIVAEGQSHHITPRTHCTIRSPWLLRILNAFWEDFRMSAIERSPVCHHFAVKYFERSPRRCLFSSL